MKNNIPVIGASHDRQIYEGVYQIGSSSNINLEYNKGPTEWLHPTVSVFDISKMVTIPCDGGFDNHDSSAEYDLTDTPWLPMSTAPKNETILLCTNLGVVSAWYAEGEWSNHYEEGLEYSPPVWVCYDDEFQIEIEETPKGEICEALGWMPMPKIPQLKKITHNDE